ncbi:MAG: hypothetical protein Fur002_19830 [Anaerolineales bacterium]
MENKILTTLNPDDMRSVMRAWTAGVAVASVSYEGATHGMTVNSFTSISLYPPFISVSLQKSTRAHDLALNARALALTILTENQTAISDLFAGRNPEIKDRFAHLQVETLITGAPLIVGGLAWLDCRIVQTFDAGTNTLFIAEVLAARAFEGKPLAYHNREYWTLQGAK